MSIVIAFGFGSTTVMLLCIAVVLTDISHALKTIEGELYRMNEIKLMRG